MGDGFLVELEKRVDKISGRLDFHISQCSTRFFLLVAAVGIATTIILAAVAWWHH